MAKLLNNETSFKELLEERDSVIRDLNEKLVRLQREQENKKESVSFWLFTSRPTRVLYDLHKYTCTLTVHQHTYTIGLHVYSTTYTSTLALRQFISTLIQSQFVTFHSSCHWSHKYVENVTWKLYKEGLNRFTIMRYKAITLWPIEMW